MDSRQICTGQRRSELKDELGMERGGAEVLDGLQESEEVPLTHVRGDVGLVVRVDDFHRYGIGAPKTTFRF